MQTIENPYIALELDGTSLEAIRGCLWSSLQREGLHAEVPTRSAHVSIGYTLGCAAEDALMRLVDAIAGYRIELRVCGVEFLEGMTTPYDYIALKLEESSEFRIAKETIEKNLETKRFPDGFKVHVTLLQAPKGFLKRDCSERLKECLQEAAQPLCRNAKVCGEKVAVFDSERRCRIEKHLSTAC